MTDLKPCPWCKSNSLDISDKSTTISFKRKRHVSVYCKKCNSYGPRVVGEEQDWNHATAEDIQKAKDLWNNRVPQSIETPLGTLEATIMPDKDYPGISIDLIDKEGIENSIALIEHAKDKGLRTLAWEQGTEDYVSSTVWRNSND
jgi:hypothetical protein